MMTSVAYYPIYKLTTKTIRNLHQNKKKGDFLNPSKNGLGFLVNQ